MTYESTEMNSSSRRHLTPSIRARLAEVAQAYWVDGLTVEDIGRRLSLSRSTVSRMLARAREERVIEFVVHTSEDRPARLATLISSQFNVRSVVVATDPAMSTAAQLDHVAAAAAEQLGSMVASDMIVTIAWGSTVEAMSRHLTPRQTQGLRIVQYNGSGNTFNFGVSYAGSLLDRFADAYAGRVQLFPVPAFFDSASTREAMWRERSIQRVLRVRRNADILVSSVGTLRSEVPGHLYRSGYLDAADIQELLTQGVVGDLGAMFFRADGSYDRIGVNDRSTGMALDDVRRLRTRLVIAAGAAKAPALRAALRARLVTDIVIDEAAAEALLSD